MRHPRRPLALGIAAVAALALTACSTTTADDGGAREGTAGTAGSEVDKILFDYPFTALPVYGALVPIIEQQAADRGVEVVFTNDEMDLAKQVSQLTSYVTSDVDAVVSFPVDPASLEDIARQYQDAGKYWVTYGGDMENQDATLQFGFYESGSLLGTDAGEWAVENVGPDAKVLVLEDQTRQIGQERTQGLLDGLKEAAPDAQVVVQQQAITPDEGMSVATAALAQHPDINVVIAAVGDAAQGAYQALVQSGRAEDDAKTYVGGLDPNLFNLQKMRDGGFFRAASAFSVFELAQQVIDIPIALGKGEKDASVDLPVTLITVDSSDLDQYITDLGG